MSVDFTNTNVESGRFQAQMVMCDRLLILKLTVWQWNITALRSYFWFSVLTLSLNKTASHHPLPFCCVQTVEPQTKEFWCFPLTHLLSFDMSVSFKSFASISDESSLQNTLIYPYLEKSVPELMPPTAAGLCWWDWSSALCSLSFLLSLHTHQDSAM